MIEGDGSIYVPSTFRNSKGRKNTPHIEIAFDIKDSLLFEKIKEKIGGGYILIRPNNKSGRLIIKRKIILYNVINLINGRMRIPKLEALYRLIDWWNIENPNNYISKLKLDLSPIDQNSWLSGFAEADGNFYLKWDKSQKSKLILYRPINIIYYFRLSQREYYKRKMDPNLTKVSNKIFMEKIAKCLKTELIFINRTRINWIEKAYLIKTDRVESKDKLFSYFDDYPLFGYKYFACNNLKKRHYLIRTSEYKTEEGKLKFEKYSNLMKYDSMKHNWSHLNKFYDI